MKADPIADAAAGAELRDERVANVLSLVVLDDRRPALTYDQARDALPIVEDFAQRIADLRGWLTYIISQDCAANLRTELRIGDRVYTFKGSAVYAIERPDDLHAALAGAVLRGEISKAELDAAIVPETIPSRIEWRVHNGRLNDLVKRGGAVADAIKKHRVESTSPATLKPKGK